MELSHIEHLGIAVKSLDEAIPYYENILGLKCYSIEEVADQKVRTAFFKIGQTKLELLESTSADGTIASFIEKRGEGIHHIAFAVKDGVQNALNEVEGKGVKLIDKTPRKGAEGLNIAFVKKRVSAAVRRESTLSTKKVNIPLVKESVCSLTRAASKNLTCSLPIVVPTLE